MLYGSSKLQQPNTLIHTYIQTYLELITSIYLELMSPNVRSLLIMWVIIDTIAGLNSCKGRVCPGINTTPGSVKSGIV